MDLARRALRAFPPPSYVAMPGAGIDISSGSVRSVSFRPNGSVSYRKTALPEGVVVDGDIEKEDALVEVLRSFRLKERIHFAHTSLLERKAYLYQTIIPRGERNLRAAVEFDLEEHVPIPPSEAAFDFEVVRDVEAGTVVSVTAFATRIVEQYRAAFKRAGITLRSLEVESQALARALCTPSCMDEAIMAVDFGRKTTRIVVLDHGVASFTATVDVGGEALTTAVMKHFGVEAKEAEQIKNERGFLEGKENRDLYEALMTTISVVKDEVARHLAYWNSPSDDDAPRKQVERVILVGGNANLKGFPEYLSRTLDLPVQVANVWSNAFSLDEYVPPISFYASLECATAVGLALRSHRAKSW